jgi:tetratricopeptide (TPR) repeat protein
VGVDAKSYAPSPEESSKKIYDFGFVGVVDPERRAKRSRLIATLSRKYSLKTAGNHSDGWIGPNESSQIYRQSKLALNENLFPGVTLRMMEAMASGSVLFTEKAGGDLGELFKAGEDFAWFEPNELMEAAELWLSDSKLRQRAAKRAMEKVQSNHDISNRAETFLNIVNSVNPGKALYDNDALEEEGKHLFLTALRWPNESGQQRIMRAESKLKKAFERGTITPESLFMLGHIQRLRKKPIEAKTYLERAFEEGEPRGALGLGILSLHQGDPVNAREWLAKFTQNDSFPSLGMDTLSYEAAKLIGARLMELGDDVSPGFSRFNLDPAMWTAFEYYYSAFTGKSDDLELARPLAGLLLSRGAAAEAMDVAQKALESHPEDEVLGAVFSEAAKASYLTVN